MEDELVEMVIVAIFFVATFGLVLWLIYINIKLKWVGKELVQRLDTELDNLDKLLQVVEEAANGI